MVIIKRGLPVILRDNDMQYIAYITQVIGHIDKEAEVVIVKGLCTYSYNITPSEPGLKERLITELRLANEVLNIPVEFSRTMDFSRSIHFRLL